MERPYHVWFMSWLSVFIVNGSSFFMGVHVCFTSSVCLIWTVSVFTSLRSHWYPKVTISTKFRPVPSRTGNVFRHEGLQETRMTGIVIMTRIRHGSWLQWTPSSQVCGAGSRSGVRHTTVGLTSLLLDGRCGYSTGAVWFQTFDVKNVEDPEEICLFWLQSDQKDWFPGQRGEWVDRMSGPTHGVLSR